MQNNYNYKLQIKSWQDLIRDAEYVDINGIHFKNGYTITKSIFAETLRTDYFLYAIDIGFMGALAYFKKDGSQAPYINDLAKQPIWDYIPIKENKCNE